MQNIYYFRGEFKHTGDLKFGPQTIKPTGNFRISESENFKNT